MLRRLMCELKCFGGECAIALFVCAAAVGLTFALLVSLALGHLIEVFNPKYARRARALETSPGSADALWSRVHYTRG